MSETESSESECDWEEVTDQPTTQNQDPETSDYKFPNEGIQITLDKKNFEIGRRGKKALDPAAIIRRELNRQIRDLQVDLHHVSLLCLLSQGLRFNGILRDQELFDIATTTLQSKKSAHLPKHVDLGYMEKLVRWFRGTYVIDPELVLVDNSKGEESVLKVCTLKQNLTIQFTEYKVANNNYLVFVFVLILRSMGIQARLIWSLQPLPLKPRSEDLVKAPSKIIKKEKLTENNSIKSESCSMKSSPIQKKGFDNIVPDNKTKASANMKNKNKKQKLEQESSDSDNSEYELRSTDEEKRKVSLKSKTAKQSLAQLKETQRGNSKSKVLGGKDSSKNGEDCSLEGNRRRVNSSCDSPTPAMNKRSTRSTSGTLVKNDKSDSPVKRVLRGKSQSKPNAMKNNAKDFKRMKTVDSEEGQESSGSSDSDSDSDFDSKPKKKILTTKISTSASSDTAKSTTDDSSRLTSRRVPRVGRNDSQNNVTHNKSTSKNAGRTQSTVLKNKKDNLEDNDSDFVPTKNHKNKSPTSSPISTSSNSTPTNNVKKIVSTKSAVKFCDFWAEVYLEEEERWISVDLIDCQFLCDSNFERKSVQPLYYVLAFGNHGQVKDVTRRYASQWLTVTQKNRADNQWWNSCIRPFRGVRTGRDKEEDEFLDQQVLSQAHPKSIQEFKNHPLFVLRRHLLKFEAIYPPEPIPVGFIRNEPFFSRECVKILHAREPWLKKAKVVRMGEIPYKVVKSRPKYIRLTGQVIKDQPLELFGEWQVENYIPPNAKDGKVPRNEYGNVNLFLQKMLPGGTVHLNLPGLQRVARKLDIDCAPAVVGFDFHGGSHPIFEGFVVCEEHKDILLDAWNQDQDELVKKEEEKRKARIYGNWEKLIKGVLIREKLERRYLFNLGGKRKPPAATESSETSTTSDTGDTPSSKRRRRGR